MARNQLYVANFGDDITAEQLHELFAEKGEVASVTIIEEEHKFGTNTAIVEMAVEKQATQAMHKLNGTEFEGRYLFISYPEPDPTIYEKGLSSKARRTAETICAELEETERKPVRRIHTMVLVCGFSFVQAVLKEAREVYAGEGIMTFDGSRKRNFGGVFFTLANRYMSYPMYKLIHLKGGKLPGYQKEDDVAIYHLITNPHPEIPVEEA